MVEETEKAMVKMNIYVHTSLHGPKESDGLYGYLVECEVKDKKITLPHDIDDRFCYYRNTTETELALHGLMEVLGRITRSCDVKLFITAPRVRQALAQDFMKSWEASGWKNAKGEDIQYVFAWQALAERIKAQAIRITLADKSEKDEYAGWFETEFIHRLRKEHTVSVSGALAEEDGRPIRLS